jgi:hypothetical protein
VKSDETVYLDNKNEVIMLQKRVIINQMERVKRRVLRIENVKKGRVLEDWKMGGKW